MLLFIGGAARTGKGILVRRLLAEMRLPYLNIDVLKMGLARGVPEYGIDPDAGGISVAEKLWPLVREMSASLLRDGVDYGFEGELLPQHVAALQHDHPSQIKACFLGYATITPTQKLHDIRTFSGHPNDWPSTYADSALLNIITSSLSERTSWPLASMLRPRYSSTLVCFCVNITRGGIAGAWIWQKAPPTERPATACLRDSGWNWYR